MGSISTDKQNAYNTEIDNLKLRYQLCKMIYLGLLGKMSAGKRIHTLKRWLWAVIMDSFMAAKTKSIKGFNFLKNI